MFRAALGTSVTDDETYDPSTHPDYVFSFDIDPTHCFSDGSGLVQAEIGEVVSVWRSTNEPADLYLTGNTVFTLEQLGGKYVLQNADGGDGSWTFAGSLAPSSNLSTLFPTAITLTMGYWIDTVAAPARAGVGVTNTVQTGNWTRYDGVSYAGWIRSTRVDATPIIPLGFVTETNRTDVTNYTRRINGVEDVSEAASFDEDSLTSWRIGANGLGTGSLNGYLFGGIVAMSAYLSNEDAALVESRIEAGKPV